MGVGFRSGVAFFFLDAYGCVGWWGPRDRSECGREDKRMALALLFPPTLTLPTQYAVSKRHHSVFSEKGEGDEEEYPLGQGTETKENHNQISPFKRQRSNTILQASIETTSLVTNDSLTLDSKGALVSQDGLVKQNRSVKDKNNNTNDTMNSGAKNIQTQTQVQTQTQGQG